MTKEPVAIWAAIAAIIVSFLSKYDITWLDSATLETFLSAAAVLIAAWLGRRKVASQHTLNQAGFTMKEVERRAASPHIMPVIES